MLKMAQHGKESHRLASHALIYKRYMDDIIGADSNADTLLKTRNRIDDLIGHFGFEIKEWLSNDKHIGKMKRKFSAFGITYAMTRLARQ